MRNLGVWIEIGGLQTYVGRIIGEKEEDARFSYAEEYLSGNIARPISMHLPLSANAFSVDDTRNFLKVCYLKDLPEDVWLGYCIQTQIIICHY